jgi:hypothetical protein
MPTTEWEQQAGMTGDIDADNVQDLVDQAEDSKDAAAASETAAATSATSAASSATSAASSATSATTSASTAATKASEASASATNAANSATASATSATAAQTAKTAAETAQTAAEAAEANASTSEANAATSESNAATSETNASTSETNAASSATSAAGSATTATTQATNASTSASNALNSANAASASETAAAASETAAAASESAAAASESAAAASESAASTSETNAANSASSASTSASQAATSATSAATSATNAAASYDSFDDRYLGAKASDPSVDNDGDALITGALYFDSTNNVMKVYDGAAWGEASSSISGIKQDFLYTATSGQTAFSGADDNAVTMVIDRSDLLSVFLNGVRLIETTDYTVNTSTNTVTLVSGATTGDTVEMEVFGNFAGQSGAEVNITGGQISGITSLGVDGNATFGDNDKAIFGAGSDLQIYSDGANAVVDHTNTSAGALYLKGDNNVIITNQAGTENKAVFASNGAVTLYYDNSAKLATTSTGINVTGTVTADGLTVDGSGSFVASANDSFLNINHTGTEARLSATYNSTGSWTPIVLRTQNDDRLRIANNGDISFYEDTGTTPKFFWDASAERLGIGTSDPERDLHVKGKSGDPVHLKLEGDPADYARIMFDDGTTDNIGELRYNFGSDYMSFNTNSSERMRIDSSGNVGIGNTSPSTQVSGWAATAKGLVISHEANAMLVLNDTTDSTYRSWIVHDSGNLKLWTQAAGYMNFATNNTERMRIDSSGNVLVSTTDPDVANNNGSGFAIQESGTVEMSRSGSSVIRINRQQDGTLVTFKSAGSTEGSIAVSGTTVSYNGGHLARWSQLTDGTKDESIVKGTVLTNLDQMAVWHHEATEAKEAYTEDNEQLNCMAVSSVEGDPNVAGVFVNWDDDDDEFNDMNIAMTGDMVIRIAQGTTVARGDLLMSAGDGTAKPQGDDIVRSKTIAKVTSTNVSHTYDDGSYLVPCVLMAC